MFNFSRVIAVGALAIVGGVATQASASTVNYTLDNNYCSIACTLPAGTIQVTEMGDPDGGGSLHSFLAISVSLSAGTLFRTNGPSFLLNLVSGITGLTATNVASNGAQPWTFITNPGPQVNPINNHTPPGPWTAGFEYTGGNINNGSTLSFNLRANQDLTLASLLQYPDKNNPVNLLWFAAEISQNGNTGYVGAEGSSACTNCGPNPPGETPIPGAAFLMGSILAGGTGFGAWRRRRQNKFAA